MSILDFCSRPYETPLMLSYRLGVQNAGFQNTHGIFQLRGLQLLTFLRTRKLLNVYQVRIGVLPLVCL